VRTNDAGYQASIRSREKLAAFQRKADLKTIMADPSGRRFIYDLVMERCKFGEVYAGNDAGIHRHAGRREVGIELTNEIQDVAPQFWQLMIAEQLEAKQNERLLREAAETKSSRERGEPADA